MADPLKLYPYDGYQENLKVWTYMELSHQGGRKYKEGTDAEDNKIFQKHKKEDDEDSLLRRGRSSVVNYCRFFSDRFGGYLAKKEPSRCGIDGDNDWAAFTADATGGGQALGDFVKEWQKRSLRLSPYWARIDTTNTPAAPNLLEERKLGRRPLASLADPRNIIDYEIDPDSGDVIRLVVREEKRFKFSALETEEIMVIFTEWTPFQFMKFVKVGKKDVGDFTIQDPIMVQPIGEPEPNPWGFVPFVPLHFGDPEDENPMFSPSMTHDVSNFQRDVFRLLSLLYEELFDRTFTTTVVFGADANEVQAQLASTLLCIKDKGGSIDKAGSDTSQTEALLDALHFAVRNTFRVAQFEASGDAKETRTAESGEKRRRDLEGLYQVMAAYSARTGTAENRLIQMWERMMKKEAGNFSCSNHPRDFDVQTVDEDIDQLMNMITSRMPITFLNEIRRGVIDKMRPHLNKKTWDLIETELQRLEEEDAMDPEDDDPVEPVKTAPKVTAA